MSKSDAFVEMLLSLIATFAIKIISRKKLRIQRFSQIFLLQMGDWNLPGADYFKPYLLFKQVSACGVLLAASYEKLYDQQLLHQGQETVFVQQ